MTMNVTQKIIHAHLLEGETTPGTEIALKIDQTLTQDATGTLVMLELESMGIERTKAEISAQYVDHNLIQEDYKNPDDHIFLESASKRFGFYFSRPGNGVSHPVHMENFGVPGKTLAGSDSHTCAAGSLGMLAIGSGGLEVAMAIAGHPLYIKMPKVFGVKLTGKLPNWVSAKDIILEMLRRYGVKGGVGYVIEYYGPGLKNLTAMDRHVIANMGAELGATSTVFPSDEITKTYLTSVGRGNDWIKFAADKGATYDKTDEINLKKLEQIDAEFDLSAAEKIKAIEKTTNHDVKAVEYFLQQQCEKDPELAPYIPLIHFACTSEDINNLTYSMMLTEARDQVLLPAMRGLINTLRKMAHDYAALPMLSRTHGQPASPTTLGKECANFVARLEPICNAFAAFQLPGKMNGAVGNFNAHYAAYPDVNWPAISQQFIAALGLFYSEYTTQIEPHDRLVEWLQILVRFNNVLIDYCRDVWGYISLGYFQQKVIASEVGSSTMPHKVNPIDFENAEGNLGVANSLANHLINKLPISRWQRDLTDSTVMRNLGSILGYALIAYQSIEKGNSKLSVNKERIEEDLNAHAEVITEAVQTILRRHGVNDAYEKLKALSRGKTFDKKAYLKFVDELVLPAEAKNSLRALSPENYLGCAVSLAKKIGKS